MVGSRDLALVSARVSWSDILHLFQGNEKEDGSSGGGGGGGVGGDGEGSEE